MSNEMPLTACTVPRRVSKRTCRSSTVRAAAFYPRARNFGSSASRNPSPIRLNPSTEMMIAMPGMIASNGADRQVVVDLREHRSPLRSGRILRPEPEEAERRDVDDRGRHRERPLHDQAERSHSGGCARRGSLACARPPSAPLRRSRSPSERAPIRVTGARRSGCSRRRRRASPATTPAAARRRSRSRTAGLESRASRPSRA